MTIDLSASPPAASDMTAMPVYRRNASYRALALWSTGNQVSLTAIDPHPRSPATFDLHQCGGWHPRLNERTLPMSVNLQLHEMESPCRCPMRFVAYDFC